MTARRLFATLSTAAVISIAGWQIASSPVEAQGGLTAASPRGQQGAGPFKTLKRARNKADKLDNEYGGYAHIAYKGDK